ncbi:flavodoxin [Shewanella psychrophila]|uniref:Flavodoxin n=1 Tax=Shewanella psychrophila TaxID=225848 RepID=A0A1S6HP43_9GAMM|nr:flavodoxin [Shewanella psychrophila]AQS37301.1 flavodoxin [Shewanella psychrophila]
MKKVNLVFGTVYGNAQFVAETLLGVLKEESREVSLLMHDQLDGFVPPQDELLLVICSTTGQGDVPEDIQPWFENLKATAPYMPELKYGVIALGDSSYETFCGAGVKFDELLTECSAKRIGEVLKIDACETMEPEVEAKAWLQSWNALIDTEIVA